MRSCKKISQVCINNKIKTEIFSILDHNPPIKFKGSLWSFSFLLLGSIEQLIGPILSGLLLSYTQDFNIVLIGASSIVLIGASLLLSGIRFESKSTGKLI